MVGWKKMHANHLNPKSCKFNAKQNKTKHGINFIDIKPITK